MIDYTTPQFMEGKSKRLTLTAHGKCYKVDRATYMRALVDCPECFDQFAHSVKLEIDGTEYPDAIDEVLVHIYHAAYEDTILVKPKYTKFGHSDLGKLPRALAIVNWCSTMLRPSRSYSGYLEALTSSVRDIVDIVRSLVEPNTRVAQQRLDKIAATGLPLGIPAEVAETYYSPMPLLASTHTGYRTLLDIANEEKSRLVYLEQTRIVCSVPGEYTLSVPRAEQVSTGATIVEYQNTMVDYICGLVGRLALHEHPEYLKIGGFGQECSDLLRRLMPPPELAICGDLDICDVFEHGVGVLVHSAIKTGKK